MGMAGDVDPDISGTFNGCSGIVQGTGVFYSRSSVGFRDVLDGTSQTIMIGERAIPTDLGWGWSICGGHECEHYVTSTLGLLKGNTVPAEYFIHTQHLWSWHPGGAHVGLTDGSIRFLSYSIDYNMYKGLSTRSGGEVISGEY